MHTIFQLNCKHNIFQQPDGDGERPKRCFDNNNKFFFIARAKLAVQFLRVDQQFCLGDNCCTFNLSIHCVKYYNKRC